MRILSFRFCLLLLAAAQSRFNAFGAPPGASASPQALPKIRIAPDGRTFADENGRPFVPFGVNYYRRGTGCAMNSMG
jgi:hypothetical protein